MEYAYLAGAVVLMSILGLLGTAFNRKHAGEAYITPLYNFALCAFACLTWGVIYALDFSFSLKVFPYALGFGVCFAVIMLNLTKALGEGNTSLTVLIQKFSLIATTIWGFAVWGTWEMKKAPLILSGLVLAVCSLCLCLYSGKKSKKSISLKWAGYTFIAFLGNTGCAIVQKQQQIDCNGRHGAMFMFFAILVATLICFAVFCAGKKPDCKGLIKTSWYYPLGAGVSNALGNMCIVWLATSPLSPNLIYPAMAVGGLAITSIASLYFFKEKLKWWQWIGVALGVLAVALLSIS